MPHLLKNEKFDLAVDLPGEGYSLARFDWTGKIVAVKYRDKYLTGTELAESAADTPCGKGLYNEFGIERPPGYAETAIGDWFHKIGVGLLRKEESSYDFSKAYAIRPAAFEVRTETDRIVLTCRSQAHHGYAYILEKSIRLMESGFAIRYRLTNTGQKPINTSEYNHNFLAPGRDPIGSHYRLRFPFQIKPGQFNATVDPEELIQFAPQEVHFKGHPTRPFFFSNLSGGEHVAAHWNLENCKSNIGISETGDFQTTAVNLWGSGHVVSPELFIDIDLEAGQSRAWSRTYRVHELAVHRLASGRPPE